VVSSSNISTSSSWSAARSRRIRQVCTKEFSIYRSVWSIELKCFFFYFGFLFFTHLAHLLAVFFVILLENSVLFSFFDNFLRMVHSCLVFGQIESRLWTQRIIFDITDEFFLRSLCFESLNCSKSFSGCIQVLLFSLSWIMKRLSHFIDLLVLSHLFLTWWTFTSCSHP